MATRGYQNGSTQSLSDASGKVIADAAAAAARKLDQKYTKDDAKAATSTYSRSLNQFK